GAGSHKRELKKKITSPFYVEQARLSLKRLYLHQKALRPACSTIALAALKKGSASSKLGYRG
ncbi:MAG: hypothetical protein LBS62_14060, partial [Clostridiales bacterium]|nr:hypothetical protein [Clostridiales bacterium]